MGQSQPEPWRMASPHVPGKGWEEVAAVVGGEPVTSYGMGDVDALVHQVNRAETVRRRMVGGYPQEHWYVVIDAMFEHGLDEAALLILDQLIDSAEQLAQYDTREPQDYWYNRAAMIHHRRGDHDAEAAVLDRWLAHWPADRWRPNHARQRIVRRLQRIREGPWHH